MTKLEKLTAALVAIAPEHGERLAAEYIAHRHRRGMIYSAYIHLAKTADAPAGQKRALRRKLAEDLTTAHHDCFTMPEIERVVPLAADIGGPVALSKPVPMAADTVLPTPGRKDEEEKGSILIDVQSRTFVIVTCTPELDGDFTEREFSGPTARDRAEAYAESEARRLGVDYASNAA